MFFCLQSSSFLGVRAAEIFCSQFLDLSQTATTAKKLKCFSIAPESTAVTTKCPRLDCRNPFIWAEEICECICPVDCTDGFALDEFCNCIELPPDSTTTTECPVRVTCPNHYVWLETICECVSQPFTCPDGSFAGGDCECTTDSTITTTDITPDTTLPDCGEIECPDGFNMDPLTCQCYPPETTLAQTTLTTKDCIERPCKLGSFWFGDPVCDCFEKCKYSKQCRVGEVWDWYFCNCRKDENYVSTTE